MPPAPVKWEGPRQLFLEEWTELVGTTEPLPDHAARVTAPVEGRVSAVLGLFGIALLTFDKLRLSGLDYSAGITAVRNARAAEVNAGNTALGRSPLLYVGFVIMGTMVIGAYGCSWRFHFAYQCLPCCYTAIPS